MKSILSWAILVANFYFSFPLYAADIRLLFVGNSYTYGYNLDEIVKSLMQQGVPLYRDVFVRRHAPGGWRWEQHRQDAESTTSTAPLRDYLVTGQDPNYRWDFVMFQEQSQIPGFPQSDSYWLDSLGALRGLIALVKNKGGTPVLWMTWGRRKGDSGNPQLFPNYKTMQSRLSHGYRAYAAQIATAQSPVVVAPVGLAWEKVYDDLVTQQQDPLATQSRFSSLFEADDSHPTARGAFLSACVIYATLTGRDPSLIAWDPANLSPSERQYYQNIAFSVVWQDALAGFAFPWVFDWKSYVWPTDIQGQGKAISSPYQFPLVRLRHDAGTLDTLQLGTQHKLGTGTQVGQGRLVLETGARLVILAELTVGLDGAGQIQHREGFLQTKHLRIGKQPHSWYQLLGGTLQVENLSSSDLFSMTGGRLEVLSVDANLIQKGGTLAPGPGLQRTQIQSSYQLESKGTLEIQVDAFATEEGKGADLVQAKDTIQIAGTVSIEWKPGLQLQPGQTITILRAKRIDLLPGWTWKAPPDVRWQRKELPDAHILVIYQESTVSPELSAESTLEPGSSMPDENATSSSDAGENPVSEQGQESGLTDSISKPEQLEPTESVVGEEGPEPSTSQGCCQTGQTGSGWEWLIAVIGLGLLIRLNRSDL